jgi:hypothetical protein
MLHRQGRRAAGRQCLGQPAGARQAELSHHRADRHADALLRRDAQACRDKKTNPPIGMFKVSVKPRGGVCIQCIAETSFRYDKKNYAGNYETIEVSSDQDSKTVKVQIVS